jgi:hypothetical protein
MQKAIERGQAPSGISTSGKAAEAVVALADIEISVAASAPKVPSPAEQRGSCWANG